MNPNLSYSLETLNSGQNRRFFVSYYIKIWWMTLKNNRAPLLCFKLCASFHSHQWIQARVTVRKRSIRVKISNFFTHVTLKFDGWPFNTLRPRQNGCRFTDNVSKCFLLNENVWISIIISLKFVPEGHFNNIPPLVQIMAWHWPGNKPLSEPMMESSLMHISFSLNELSECIAQ